MTTNDLALLRRKEAVGTAALVFWIVVLLGGPLLSGIGIDVDPAEILAWSLTAAWVAMDAHYRDSRYVAWGLLALVTGPVGFFLYLVARRHVPPICLRCGANLANTSKACPVCGRRTLHGRLWSYAGSVYGSLEHSLARGPVETVRQTTRNVTFTLAATMIITRLLAGDVVQSPLQALSMLLYVLTFAGYWVLLAWWVYLDATWRRMEAVPWAILALVTNLVGLVTYLVIRYPDPRVCPGCNASLGIGLKRCPYCGAEAEPVCPRCQAPIRPDWLYCPSCSTKLPASQNGQDETSRAGPGHAAPPTLTISGTVADALSGAPIPNVEVKIDSRSNPLSTVTDAQGRFALADLAPRPYVVVASAPGYAPESKAYTPSATASSLLHFSLYPAAGQDVGAP